MASGAIEIKVTPEVLDKKAMELLNDIRTTESLFSRVQETVEKTSYYWKGEAGDHHRQMFREQQDEILQIFKRLHDYPINLDEISQKFSETENKEQDRNAAIPSSLID